jgi:hypothetical protein
VACNAVGQGVCHCGISAEGNPVCASTIGFCQELEPCNSSADCTAPRACVDVSGCCAPSLPSGSRTCLLPCASPQ